MLLIDDTRVATGRQAQTAKAQVRDTVHMRSSLKSLLDGFIDYAGTFPPAGLTVTQSFDNYLRYLRGPEQVIVSRFAISSKALPELIEELDRRPTAPEVPITVIGSGSQDLDSWHDALETDAGLMTEFVNEAGERAAIEAYEVRIPSNDLIETCVRDMKAFDQVDAFLELPWGPGMTDSLAVIAQSEWLAAKARTGGATLDAYPSTASVATFIHGCAALELSFKLTAGLHHALPKIDRETGAKAQGFLNVLAACGFALVHDLTTSELANVLTSPSAEDWRFGDAGLSWKGIDLTLEDIDDSRGIFWSIGSCSVEEALNDLDALGLIAGGR